MSRKTTATRKQAESMSQLDLAMLLNVDELKAALRKFFVDDSIPQSVVDAMSEALESKIPESEFVEFCDTL